MDRETIKVMWRATKEGDLGMVKRMICSSEELLNVVISLGSWLHIAATYGKIEVVKYLIECGIDVNLNGGLGNCNALRNAAFEGYLDIVKVLYQNGAILDVSNPNRNPLFAAIYNGHYDIVKFLVENGIDITANYSIGKLDKVDAYEYARQFGQTEIANYLKSKLDEK